jgi:hypothetical protein
VKANVLIHAIGDENGNYYEFTDPQCVKLLNSAFVSRGTKQTPLIAGNPLELHYHSVKM